MQYAQNLVASAGHDCCVRAPGCEIPPMTTNTLIVASNHLLRRGLVATVGEMLKYRICGEAIDGASARLLSAKLKPSLILMVLPVDDDDGILLLKDLVHVCLTAPIVVIGTNHDPEHVGRILAAGARGYLLSEIDLKELQAACEVVLRGELAVSPIVSQALWRGLSRRKRATQRKGDTARLSDREFEVFTRLGRGDGPTAIRIALGISVKTVESHIARIKSKMRVASNVALRKRALAYLQRTA